MRWRRTYGNFNGIFMPHKTNLRRPTSASDHRRNKHKPLIIRRIARRDVCAVRGPAIHRVGLQHTVSSIAHILTKLAVRVSENIVKKKRYQTHLNRLKNVLPGESSNGFLTSASRLQSSVLQILTVLSSDCVARNSPTGSQHTPFTKPWWRSSFWRRSVKTRCQNQQMVRKTDSRK